MPLMEGHQRCACGHPREQHLQRQRSHEPPRRGRLLNWVEAERLPAPQVKLAGCLLCACEAFRFARAKPLR